MKKAVAAGLMGALFATGAFASDSASERVLQRYAAETPIRDSVSRYAEASYEKTPEQKIFDKYFEQKKEKHELGPVFWILSGAAAASVVADVEYTFKNKKKCEAFVDNYVETHPGSFVETPCRDAYPTMIPFVKSGKLATYLFAGGAALAGIVYGAHEKRNDKSSWFIWPSLIITGHTHGIISNKSFKIEITIVK